MNDLILRLSENLAPVSQHHVSRRLAIGMFAGSAIAIMLVLVLLGPRPDMAAALATPMFWVKLLYPLSLAAIAGFVSERLARPAASAGARVFWIAAPVAIVLLLALVQFISVLPEARMGIVMGGSARVCPLLVLASSIPPLAGLVWAMRGLAPTRLREAGAMIGLAAGGAGAFAYAWHCTETGAPFLALWYSLGIALAVVAGWLSGPFVLRWR
jgi:hypothetical protein